MFSTYSERDNTEAADMPGVVPANVRSSVVNESGYLLKRRAFMKVGSNRTLFESENKEVIFMVLLKTT
jgi:threonylcarbamoyladenosine tRNA methylthiotransferase MtaB